MEKRNRRRGGRAIMNKKCKQCKKILYEKKHGEW